MSISLEKCQLLLKTVVLQRARTNWLSALRFPFSRWPAAMLKPAVSYTSLYFRCAVILCITVCTKPQSNSKPHRRQQHLSQATYADPFFQCAIAQLHLSCTNKFCSDNDLLL